jgi:predicted RNA-binding Zn-ribbon protein involved in translation (DUF1610 family)
MTCEHPPDSECSCYYCGAGNIKASALPYKCPYCGMELRKLMCRMTKEELEDSFTRKFASSDPMYTLAG